MDSTLLRQIEEQEILRMQWKNVHVLVILPFWTKTMFNNNVGKVMAKMQELGARLHLYCGASAEDSHYIESFPNAFLHNFRDDRTIFHSLFSFIRLLCTVKIDIVFWTYTGFSENLFLASLNLFKKIPYIVKSDSYIVRAKETLLSRINTKLLIKFPAKNADLLLVETPDIEAYTKSVFRTGNVSYFPNGAPVGWFKKLEESFQGQSPPSKAPYILYTGRIMEQKGIDLLIESFSQIADKIAGWNLEMVGPVWDKNYHAQCLKQVADKNLGGRIFFHPIALGEELYRWYYFAEFYVLPSREEGLANRIPEALYFKNPIVAYDVGQTKSMVTDKTGFLVPPGDTRAFAQAMLELAADEKKRKGLGENAKEIVEKYYNDDILIPELIRKCGRFLKKK